MRTRININYQTLYRSVINSLWFCATVFSFLYLLFVGLSGLFGSPQIFASIFGICIGLGAFIGYDAEGFQWDNNPRIVIRQLRSGEEGDEDV